MQYLAIKDAIKEQIDTGMFEAYQKLPSERTLADAFSTTRITLREALTHLESSGLIYREERRGWFVSAKKLSINPLQDYEYKTNAQRMDIPYRHHSINVDKVLASKEMLAKLKLAPFSYLIVFTNVLSFKGRKVAVQYQSLPFKPFEALLSKESDTSIYEIIQEYNAHNIEKIQLEVGIHPAHLNESIALNVSAGAILMGVKQIMLDVTNTPFLYQETNWCHDAIQLEMASSLTANAL